MISWRDIGVRRLFRLPESPRRVAREVDEELRFHLESRIAELVSHGAAPDEARARAEREYGDVAASKAELAEVDRQRIATRRRIDVFDVVRRDIASAFRGMRRQPGLTATIIITLGLGVGANASVFTMLDRVFFQPPPGVVDGNAIRRLYVHKYTPRDPYPVGRILPMMAGRDLIDLSNATRGVARLAGDYLDRGQKLQPDGQRVSITFVSPGYFDFLGVHPARGRFFAPDENTWTGAPVPVAVISDAFWRRQFAADPDVLGATVRLDQTTYTIVGVAPKAFGGLELEVTDLWAPVLDIGVGLDGPPLLRLLARVDQGLDGHAFDRMLTTQYRQTHVGDAGAGDSSAIVTAPIQAGRGPEATIARIPGLPSRNVALLARLGVVGLFVLIIAVANMASLLLMRAIRRRREIAVRIALGISRRRLVAQLMTEGAVLALVAGGVALALASLTGNALRIQLSTGIQWTSTVVDARVVSFAIALATAGGIAAAVAPAAFALRSDVSTVLRVSSAGSMRTGRAVRTALLVTQAGLCMALLACGGMFLRSLRRVGEFDRGFDPDRTLRLTAPAFYANAEEQIAQIASRLRALPGVESVGRSYCWFSGQCLASKVGRSASDTIGVGPQGPSLEFVDGDFMQAAGFRALAGRRLEASDVAAPVAVVNESLARALWPGGGAVGSCVYMREPTSHCHEVVGVVRDVRWDVEQPPVYRLYLPIAQAWSAPSRALIPNYLVIRTRAGASADDAARLRGIASPIVSRYSEVDVRTVSDLLAPERKPWQLATVLFLVLGALGLTVAVAGFYGLVAYDVEQRSRELGIRIALGATSGSVLRLVVVSGARAVLIAVGAGALLSMAMGWLMKSLLFLTSPFDPVVLLTTALVLAGTAVLASVIPAWRATRMDPVVVLTSD